VDALLLLHFGADDNQQRGPEQNDNEEEDDDGAGGEAAQARLGRRVLHVQSISPWAPACIGPYGQAAADGLGGLLHLAGQIPLDPASMELLGPAAAEGNGEETVSNSASSATVLKHTDRVLRSCQAVAVAAGGRMDCGGCAGAAVYLSPEGGKSAGAAAAAVAAFLREGRTEVVVGAAEGDEEEEDEDEDDDYVDEYLRPLEVPRGRVRVDQASWGVGGGGGGSGDEASASTPAACVYAVVPCLPRGALVEVQPTLLDLRAFAPGGGAGEPPSSSSSSSEDGGDEKEEDEEDGGAAAAAAAAPLDPDVAALAASTGATAHLRAYSWLSRAQNGSRRRRQQPQRRLAARLLVALPSGSSDLARATAAAVASALQEARPFLNRASPNVASVRAWCTPDAYAELAGADGAGGGGGGDPSPSPLDAALLAAAAPSLRGGLAGAQLLPALEVRCGSGDGALSPPCAVVVELVVLH
jgi:enamine deaminase RidA (YjgF/YER057c/UK114 family)